MKRNEQVMWWVIWYYTLILVVIAVGSLLYAYDRQRRVSYQESLSGKVQRAYIADLETTIAYLESRPPDILETTRIITRTEYITLPVTKCEYLWRTPRQFRDTAELDEYLERPVLIPCDGQDCDDLARLFVLAALKNGYLVSEQYLPTWRFSSGEHMLVMAVIGNGIYYIEPSTNQYWWISPLD